MMVCLLGLLRTERLAREMSAVTRVMDILKGRVRGSGNRSRLQQSLQCTAGDLIPTCPQTCVSESQRVLSASCLSPEDKTPGVKTKEIIKKLDVLNE